MLDRKASNQKLTSYKGDIPITSLYTVGIAGEKFFGSLKEKGEFLGTRCNKCEITYVPARYFCERCFGELREYIKVADKGEIVSFTVVYKDLDDKQLAEPKVVGAIKLDGADTVLIHFINANPAKVGIGKKVKVVLEPKAKRKGAITDIKYFELA
ncbi:Zn-ribbon domain-containing OB-fold protein [Candidatus Peregrinibacteria bacterium]|nr:Zn-ribbon domain-containing OB-fold protein [Candidatus Peregrinibacteria bacterium]